MCQPHTGGKKRCDGFCSNMSEKYLRQYRRRVGGIWELSFTIIDPSTVFSTFDIDQLGKIRRHHWKEHLKVKFEGICLNPLLRVISTKFLLVMISMLCKTERSWELRTWSHKMNLLDVLSTSPHYFFGRAREKGKEFPSSLLPRAISCPNSLPLHFRTPATQAIQTSVSLATL